MSFQCDCSIEIDEDAELFREEFPVARKVHECCECKMIIKPGQKYQKVIGKWEGEFSTFKTCLPCYNIRKHYCPNGYYFGELVEQLFNCLEFDYRKNYD